MKQLFLAFVILILATLTIPPLEERAAPYYDRLGTFLWENLEGPLGPAINPWRAVRSEAEMGNVVRELIADRNRGLIRPDPDDFQEFIQRQVDDEDGLDFWGTPYILVPGRDSVAVVSAGPDREYETEDDLVTKIRYAEPAYMPNRPR